MESSSLENLRTIEDLFIFLIKKEIFQERNVIMMQYLMRSIKRPDLELKCVEYATRDKQALCYFEEPKILGDGCRHVQLHVVDDIETFTDIDSLLSTVAAIAGCHKNSIKLVGLQPESSFVIVISMKECFAQKLGEKGPHQLSRLLQYNVDWIKIENKLINIPQDDLRLQNMDVAGQSSYESQVQSFLSGPCTTLFRKILRKYVLEEDFITRIHKSKDQVLPLLTVDQQRVLYPEKGSFPGSFKQLDLPLIYILLQNICMIEPHRRGWGKMPDPLDTSMAACIDSIMEIYREYFYNPPLCLEQSDFDRILKRILKLSENIEEVLENPKTDTIIKKMERKDEEKREKEIPLEKFRDLSLSQHLGPSVVCTSSITVPFIKVKGVKHISCLTSERLWVSDLNYLLQVDSTGHLIQEIQGCTVFPLVLPTGAHSVTEDGNLIFIKGDKVQKITLDGTSTTLFRPREYLFCVHSSRINGDILVGYSSGVLRYDWTGGHHIKLGFEFFLPAYITENGNGDIWVSDFGRREVMVMDKSGRYRFTYRGQHQSRFYPRGICTDIFGQLLVCDADYVSPGVHLLDQDGQFLRLLLTREHGLILPTAVCVDDKHNLYVGEEFSNTITVYKYLQETENLKTSIVESK